MSDYYGTCGDVRGDCGHNHHSLRTAALCTLRDQRDCQRLGGYSDRYVVRRDGHALTEDEHELVSAVENGWRN